MTSKKGGYPWAFRARFRADAFGWKSQSAITRVREAVEELKNVAKNDPIVAADGAVVFFERVSAALAHVDSSSGAIGAAVNRAIEELVGVIAAAPADVKTREAWLERLYEALAADGIPHIELLADYWGELCVAKEIASRWPTARSRSHAMRSHRMPRCVATTTAPSHASLRSIARRVTRSSSCCSSRRSSGITGVGP
jgi:hypothetical protein